MKEEKVGLTTTNWVLSIVGILLLLTLIVLPPVLRAFIKEEKETLPEKEYVIVGELVCKKNNIEEINYIDSEVLMISYQQEMIDNYTQRVERVYKDPVLYQEEKTTYGKYVTSFAAVTGYQYSATPYDDTSTVMIISKYDLNTFVPTTVSVAGEIHPTAITNHNLLMDTITETEQNFITNGYTCERNNEHKVEVK